MYITVIHRPIIVMCAVTAATCDRQATTSLQCVDSLRLFRSEPLPHRNVSRFGAVVCRVSSVRVYIKCVQLRAAAIRIGAETNQTIKHTNFGVSCTSCDRNIASPPALE